MDLDYFSLFSNPEAETRNHTGFVIGDTARKQQSMLNPKK
jgi:hypothetical protein